MIIATWKVECNVDCPYCDSRIDLYSEVRDSFEWLPSPGKTVEMDVEITCPKCETVFSIDGTQF